MSKQGNRYAAEFRRQMVELGELAAAPKSWRESLSPRARRSGTG